MMLDEKGFFFGGGGPFDICIAFWSFVGDDTLML